MPKDAKKPYFKAQSARTLYTYFDTKTSHFSMKILGELEKSCSFTVKMTVFEKLVYRVRALWVLKLGFLASLGITRQGKIFKNHLQVLPLLFHLSRPGATVTDRDATSFDVFGALTRIKKTLECVRVWCVPTSHRRKTSLYLQSRSGQTALMFLGPSLKLQGRRGRCEKYHLIIHRERSSLHCRLGGLHFSPKKAIMD